MSAQTVKGHIRNAKAIYNWAHRFGLVSRNLFADFDGKPLPTDPNRYVSPTVFETVVKAAPTPGWRVMFGLCRLAGLRLEAARTLPWSGRATDSDGKRHRVGIDWDRRRVREAFRDVVRVAILRTRPPVDEEGEEVGCADGAVAVEVGGAAFARPPRREA